MRIDTKYRHNAAAGPSAAGQHNQQDSDSLVSGDH